MRKMPPRQQGKFSARPKFNKISSRRSITENIVSKPRTRSSLPKSANNSTTPSTYRKSSLDSPSRKKSTGTLAGSPSRNKLVKESTPTKSSQKHIVDSPSKNLRHVKKTPTKSIQRSPSAGNRKSSSNISLKTTSPVPDKHPTTLSKKVAKSPSQTTNYVTSPARQTRKTALTKLPSPVSSQRKSERNSSPPKIQCKLSRPPVTESSVSCPASSSSSTRKRLLCPPASPQAAKSRRLKSNISNQSEVESSSDAGNIVLNEDKKSVLDAPHSQQDTSELECRKMVASGFLNIMKGKGDSVTKASGTTLPSDPELSGRFLRRKWFSLKAHGGFTCLRSAILSPAEIAQEVMQHTMVEPPKDYQANFFTTKLMVRLSSRLPPARARPSCEELVDLINSQQSNEKIETLKESTSKSECTAIRVKVEKRTFSDTMSHVTSDPSKTCDAPSTNSPQSRSGKKFQGKLTKKQERDIALKQLKTLRHL